MRNFRNFQKRELFTHCLEPRFKHVISRQDAKHVRYCPKEGIGGLGRKNEETSRQIVCCSEVVKRCGHDTEMHGMNWLVNKGNWLSSPSFAEYHCIFVDPEPTI